MPQTHHWLGMQHTTYSAKPSQSNWWLRWCWIKHPPPASHLSQTKCPQCPLQPVGTVQVPHHGNRYRGNRDCKSAWQGRTSATKKYASWWTLTLHGTITKLTFQPSWPHLEKELVISHPCHSVAHQQKHHWYAGTVSMGAVSEETNAGL